MDFQKKIILIFIINLIFIPHGLSKPDTKLCRKILSENGFDLVGGQLLLLEYLIKINTLTPNHTKTLNCLLLANRLKNNNDLPFLSLDIIVHKMLMILNTTKLDSLNSKILEQIRDNICCIKNYRILDKENILFGLKNIDNLFHQEETNPLSGYINSLKENDLTNKICENEKHFIYYFMNIEGKIQEIAREYDNLNRF